MTSPIGYRPVIINLIFNVIKSVTLVIIYIIYFDFIFSSKQRQSAFRFNSRKFASYLMTFRLLLGCNLQAISGSTSISLRWSSSLLPSHNLASNFNFFGAVSSSSSSPSFSRSTCTLYRSSDLFSIDALGLVALESTCIDGSFGLVIRISHSSDSM